LFPLKKKLQNNWGTISRIGGWGTITKIIKTETLLHLNLEILFIYLLFVLFYFMYFLFTYFLFLFLPLFFLFFSFNPLSVTLMPFQLTVE
jgi:hypothetical protein